MNRISTSRIFFCLLIMSLEARVLSFPHPFDQGASSPDQSSKAALAIRPEEVNVFVGVDTRLFTVMAALNVAGYDYKGSDSSLSSLRARVRQDLSALDPAILGRLRNYYKVHVGGQPAGPPRIAGYVGLSLLMSAPPALAIGARREGLPDDIIAALDFAPLVREFYENSDVTKLVRPAFEERRDEVVETRQQVGGIIFRMLDYLHTIPVLSLAGPIRVAPRKESSEDRNRQPVVEHRARRLFILLNPLDAPEAAYIRNDFLNGADAETLRFPGDDYFVVIGSPANLEPIQIAFLRFVLEPLSERFSAAIREQSATIGQLAERLVGVRAAQRETAFSIVNESLVQAVNTRIKRLQKQHQGEEPQIADDEAVYDLSRHFEQGAVLVFHFYEKLIPWERAGVDIASFYEEMVRSIDAGREAARANSYREVRARVEKRIEERRKATEASVRIVQQLEQANLLIQKRELEEAEGLLQSILRDHPNNARARFGRAQIVSQRASQIDPAQSDDPDAAWEKLISQLEQASALYRQAIATASEQEKWLVSQAHVAIGKMLEFAGDSEAAAQEYQKAIAIGDVPGGAFTQAKERLGKQD